MSQDFKQRFSGRLGQIDKDGNLSLENAKPVNIGNKIQPVQMSGKAIIQNNNQFKSNNYQGNNLYVQQQVQQPPVYQNTQSNNPYSEINNYLPQQFSKQTSIQSSYNQFQDIQISPNKNEIYYNSPQKDYQANPQLSNGYLQQPQIQIQVTQPYASPNGFGQNSQTSLQYQQQLNPLQISQQSAMSNQYGYNQYNNEVVQQPQNLLQLPNQNQHLQQAQLNVYQPYQQVPQEFTQIVTQMQQLMQAQQQQIQLLTKKYTDENQSTSEQKNNSKDPMKNSNARKPRAVNQPVVVMNSDKLQPIKGKKEETSVSSKLNETKAQMTKNSDVQKQSIDIDAKSNISHLKDLSESIHAKSTNEPQQDQQETQLYFSKKPRQVQYKPYSLKEYQNNSSGYQKLGGLGAFNVGTAE